jgi:hypothetical protein
MTLARLGSSWLRLYTKEAGFTIRESVSGSSEGRDSKREATGRNFVPVGLRRT